MGIERAWSSERSKRPGRTTSAGARRLAWVVASLVIVAAGSVTTASPVEAARNVPWRFTNVTMSSSISFWPDGEWNKEWVLPCPAGYTPVSGGVTAIDHPRGMWRQFEYPNTSDNTYRIRFANTGFGGSATNLTLAATCVWLEDVGTITTVTAEFPQFSGSERAGGTVRCPAGTSVFSAGVDWSTIDAEKFTQTSTPITDGTTLGTGWFVSGFSNDTGFIGVELRCVDTARLAGAYVTADDVTPDGFTTVNAVCADGYRLLTGGAGPAAVPNASVGQVAAPVSGPVDARTWRISGYSGQTMRAMAICVPAATVSVGFTQTPLQTQRNPIFAFTASDNVGETVNVTCALDGQAKACANGVPFQLSAVADGLHSFVATASNQSGSTKTASFTWTLDATVPVVAETPPATGASITGPYTIRFSEPVDGVTATSLTVEDDGTGQAIAGTVARPTPTTATWTPSAPLLPGKTYRFELSSAIKDVVGNPLTGTFFTMQTSVAAENLYVPITPKRVLDTRTGVGLSATPFVANTPRRLSVAGANGIPDDAVAITGNLTVVSQTKGGFLSITKTSIASPTTSNLNFPVGDVRANGVTVPLNGSGDLYIVYKSAAGGTAHVLLDVTGYFRASAGGASYFPLDPKRVLDTRTGVGLSAARFQAGTPRVLSVAGTNSIPADAVAITGNITVVGQTKRGFVSITTTPTSSPTTSDLNFPVGDVRANGVTVPLNGAGDLYIVYKAGAGGTADLLLDVTGYFRASASGASYVPLTPARIVDTRVGKGLSSRLTSATPRTFTVDGKGGVATDAVAITGNATVVNQTKGGFVSVTPSPIVNPTTSTLNFPRGDTRANNFVVKVATNGTDSVTYRATSGATTHLVIDVTGYYH